jgi:hypothetical protein
VPHRLIHQTVEIRLSATTLEVFQRGIGRAFRSARSVRSARHYHALPACDGSRPRDGLTLQEAAHYLGVSPTTVRRLINNQQLAARQVVPCAPWEIARDVLDSDSVREAARQITGRVAGPRTQHAGAQPSMFSSKSEV